MAQVVVTERRDANFVSRPSHGGIGRFHPDYRLIKRSGLLAGLHLPQEFSGSGNHRHATEQTVLGPVGGIAQHEEFAFGEIAVLPQHELGFTETHARVCQKLDEIGPVLRGAATSSAEGRYPLLEMALAGQLAGEILGTNLGTFDLKGRIGATHPLLDGDFEQRFQNEEAVVEASGGHHLHRLARPLLAMLNRSPAHFQGGEVGPGLLDESYNLRPIALGALLGGRIVLKLAFAYRQCLCSRHLFRDDGILAQFLSMGVVLKQLIELGFCNTQNLGFEATESGFATDGKPGVIRALLVAVEMGYAGKSPGL